MPLDSILFRTEILDANQIGITITNYGYVGNNFVSRLPSLEYPLGTGFEHLIHGGLWVGAHAMDSAGVFTGVTTATVDASQGNTTAAVTEFTPAGNSIDRRSVLPSSPYYDPAAISEMDLVAEFSDRPAKSTSSNPEPHRPLNILVRQENYAWSIELNAHVVFFHYVIRNLGAPLRDMWVGLYSEFASGPKNLYSAWPPTSGGSTIGSWFNKKWIAYEDSLRLFREHYCASLPIPAGCIASRVPPWAGLRLLGVRPGDLSNPADKRVTFAAWNYAPGSPARDQDVERYVIMSSGLIQPIVGDSLQPTTGDPVELVAVGPFDSLAPGDSIEVDFAFVGGADVGGIEENSRAAQFDYDHGYRDLYTPALVSNVASEVRGGRVELAWFAESVSQATVERNDSNSGWQERARIAAGGEGYFRWIDTDVLPGGRYGYRLEIEVDGASVISGETWVDVPRSQLVLMGPRPNPVTSSRFAMEYVLADASPATLEIYDLRGRRVLEQDLQVGARRNLVQIATRRPFAPGVYNAKLSQAGRVTTRRFVVAR